MKGAELARGQILVLFALAVPGLMGFIGLAIDAGFYIARRQAMQAAADLATLNAAYCGAYPTKTLCAAAAATPGATSAADGMAKAIAQANGFTNGVGGVTVAVTQPSGRIQVQISLTHQTFFLPVVGISSVALSAVAVGQSQPSTTGAYALFAAGSSCPSSSATYGLDISGNNFIGGALHSNANLTNSGTNNDAISVTYNSACNVSTPYPGPDIPQGTSVQSYPTGLPVPYSTLTAGSSTGGVSIALEYQRVTATGGYAAGGTLGQTRNWAAAIATYKEASGQNSALLLEIGAASNRTDGTSISLTVPAAGVAAGNRVVVAFAMDPSTGTVSCSDTRANTYARDADVRNGSGTTGVRTVICSANVSTALTSADTITVTHPSVVAKAVSAAAFSGIATSAALDRISPPIDSTTTGAGSSTSPSSGNTATTTDTEEMLIGAIGFEGTAGNMFSAGTSYALLTPAGPCGTDNLPCRLEDGFTICSTTCALDLGLDAFRWLRQCARLPAVGNSELHQHRAAGCTSTADWGASVDALPAQVTCGYQLLAGVYYFEGTGTFAITRVASGTCAQNVTLVSQSATSTLDTESELYITGRCFISGTTSSSVTCPVLFSSPTYQLAGYSGKTGVDAIKFGNNINAVGLWQAPNGQVAINGQSGANRSITGGIFADAIKISGNGWNVTGSGTTGAPGDPYFSLYQ